jgi:hypothetical protein
MRINPVALSLMLATALGCSGDSSGPKAGPPTNLGVLNQASVNQQGVIGTAAPLPLSVVVTDASNRPVSGVVVTYGIAPGAGTLSSATATTDGNGVGSVTWTLGTTFAPRTVTATVQGLAVITFTANAIAPDAGVPAFNLVDPAGDTVAAPIDTVPFSKGIDVLSVQGVFKRDSLILTMTFAAPVTFGSTDSSLAGFIEFDIDDNPTTGFFPLSLRYGSTANVGVEYDLFFNGESGSSIAGMLNIRTNVLTPVVASYPANTIVARIPMSLLGNDDGNFTIVGIIGNDHPSDILPNSGATLVRRSLGTSFTLSPSVYLDGQTAAPHNLQIPKTSLKGGRLWRYE